MTIISMDVKCNVPRIDKITLGWFLNTEGIGYGANLFKGSGQEEIQLVILNERCSRHWHVKIRYKKRTVLRVLHHWSVGTWTNDGNRAGYPRY